MLRLADGAHYRRSKRGLVLAGPTGSDTVLFEHPAAHALPDRLTGEHDIDALAAALGPPVCTSALNDLVELGILTDGAPPPATARRRFTTSGIMIDAIATPAGWIDRHVVPLILCTTGKVAIAGTLVAGLAAFATGRPEHLPTVTGHPAFEALLMLVLGMVATICHELAHAVVLAHYGMPAQRAGFGFYWGALSFFVDSTPALVLGRRERVIQALVGPAVDCVTTALFAIGAHLLAESSTLVAIVLWRLAILCAAEIVLNLLPVLQVDGHWALADWLDEPDLAPRARRAVGLAIRGRLPAGQCRLAGYGVVSLLFGYLMLAGLAAVFWYAAGDLVTALFAGNLADILIGLYYVGPLALGILFSSIGLVLQVQLRDP